MKQGIRTIQRVHGRNTSIRDSSQLRLDECVKPFNSQVMNALAVDFVTVQYYSVIRTGQHCTCEQHDESAPISRKSNPNIVQQDTQDTWADNQTYEVVDATTATALFGDHNSSIDSADDDDFEPIIENDSNFEAYSGETIFAGGNVNCGICYRSGFLPGYSLLRGDRIVLTTYDIQDAKGYSIDSSSMPYTMYQLDQSGYVEFTALIPKYYTKAQFSIRNNHEVLREKLYLTNGTALNKNVIENYKGRTMTLRCKAAHFTHIVMEFAYDADPIKANIPIISRVLDYTMLETIGNIQAILPPTIGTCAAGDLLAIPQRNLYLKIVDVENYATSTMRRLEWRATCRVLQPQESLRNIFFNHSF